MKQAAAKLSGIILAGGRSQRFGRDKARMEVGGKKVVDKIVRVLNEFPFRQLAVVTGQGRMGDWPREATVLPDDREGLGPIGGITTALRHLSSGVLVVACDMPFVTASMVEWLLEHYDAGADAIVPRHGKSIEPLFAIYEQSFLPAAEAAIEAGQYALHRVLEKATLRLVDIPGHFSMEREFANINTPEDYERAQDIR